MNELNRQAHWQKVYKDKGEKQVSWFQEKPAISLELIDGVGAKSNSAIIDIGGGASRLVDVLVSEGYRDLTVLDLSDDAIAIARSRLAERAGLVKWIVTDVTEWEPSRHYDLWHDRAAFHFLTEAADRAAYFDRLMQVIRPGGHVIIATFAIVQRLARYTLRRNAVIRRLWARICVDRNAPPRSHDSNRRRTAVSVRRVQARLISILQRASFTLRPAPGRDRQ